MEKKYGCPSYWICPTSSVKYLMTIWDFQIHERERLDATQVHIIYKLIQAGLIQTLTHPVIEYNYRWPSRHPIH